MNIKLSGNELILFLIICLTIITIISQITECIKTKIRCKYEYQRWLQAQEQRRQRGELHQRSCREFTVPDLKATQHQEDQEGGGSYEH